MYTYIGVLTNLIVKWTIDISDFPVTSCFVSLFRKHA
jgi:hypothetical protein